MLAQMWADYTKDWELLHGAIEAHVKAQLPKAGESKQSRLFREHPVAHVRHGNRRPMSV